MPNFTKYAAVLSSLPPAMFDLGDHIIDTTGKGRNKGYIPPTRAVKDQVVALLDALRRFDADPKRATFVTLSNQATGMNLHIQRIEKLPEWLYIFPKNEQSSRQNQFTIAWHVGSDSNVFGFLEHCGKDGTHMVAEEIAERVPNMKAIIANARHPTATTTPSSYQEARAQSDWAHSAQTIGAPIAKYINTMYPNSVIINMHGMDTQGDLANLRNPPPGVGPSYALIVNNWNSRYTNTTASYPKLLAIALAEYFPDREIQTAKELPGFMYGRPLTSDDNTRCIFLSRAAPHNTNYIGRKIVNKDHDTGRSAHIEFDTRLRRGGAKLIAFTKAMVKANHWWKHYDHAIHNPGALKTTRPDIYQNLLKYGELFPPLDAEAQAILNNTTITSAELERWARNNALSATLGHPIEAVSDQHELDTQEPDDDQTNTTTNTKKRKLADDQDSASNDATSSKRRLGVR